MLIVFKTLAFLILVVGFSACGGDNKDNPDDSPNENGPPVRDGASGSAALTGTWNKNCSINTDTPYNTLTLILDTATARFTSLEKHFVDDSCTTPIMNYAVVSLKGSFVIGNEITTADGVIAREVDLHITEQNETPVAERFYTLFYIDPAKPDEMVLGLDAGALDGSSANKRPNSLDFNSLLFCVGCRDPLIDNISVKTPDNLKAIWSITKWGYIPSEGMFGIRETIVAAFTDGRMTDNLPGVFSGATGNALKAGQWGSWRKKGNEIETRWDWDEKYSKTEFTVTTTPGETDQRLKGCYGRFVSYSDVHMGGDFNFSAVETWCFTSQGRFA